MFVPDAIATSEKSATEKEGNKPVSIDDSYWSKWKDAHTMEVEVITVYDYKKDGELKITETYSGDKLKSKFKEDKLTRSQILSIPGGKEITINTESEILKLKPGKKNEFVTKESIVLTAEDDPYSWWAGSSSVTSSTASSTTSSTSSSCPQWTFSKVTSFSKTYYKTEDPINLIWQGNDLKTVKSVILSKKWVDNPVEYTHYIPYPDGKWVAGDGIADSKYRISGGYHLRLWQLPDGDIVSGVHHDDSVLIIPGHQVDGYENAEAKVAGFFGTSFESYWLDNEYCNSYYNAYNDGNATVV